MYLISGTKLECEQIETDFHDYQDVKSITEATILFITFMTQMYCLELFVKFTSCTKPQISQELYSGIFNSFA